MEKEFGSIQDIVDLFLGKGATPVDVKNLIRRDVLLRDRHFIKEGRTFIFFLPAVKERLTPKDYSKKKIEKNQIIDGSNIHASFTPSSRFVIPMARGYRARI